MRGNNFQESAAVLPLLPGIRITGIYTVKIAKKRSST